MNRDDLAAPPSGPGDDAGASPLSLVWSRVAASLRRHLVQNPDSRALPGGPGPLLALLREEPRFAWMIETFGLDDMEAASVAVCLAAELDTVLRHELARMRGDPPAARPDLAVLQALLCESLDARIALQARFAWDAPLFRHRLLQPMDAASRTSDPLRTVSLAVDPQLLRTLCYGDWLDPRLARYCRLFTAAATEPRAEIDLRPVVGVLTAALAENESLLLCFLGEAGSGRLATARHLAFNGGARLLFADLGYAHHLGEFAELTTPLLREAWLQGAWLYLDGLEVLADSPTPEVQRFLDDLADDSGICILASRHPLAFGGRRPLTPVNIEFDGAPASNAWRDALPGDDALSEADVELLASRYRLPAARIHAAGLHAVRLARLERGPQATPGKDDLVRAARAQGPSGLSKLARKVEPIHRWDKLVLPVDAQRQMRELCARVEHATRVFQQWGFGARMSLGKGTSALFVGASGTGKTMAAEVIAAELGLDLYKIDLATVVSKYIGETEKNLDRVFEAARYANAVLLFDEADALFGKRSEVRDAHDRYANLEVAYLLQKMEEYEGLSVLSTNLKQNLDEAFLRRLTYTVLFPFPAAAERESIWRVTCPPDLPLAADVDFMVLAKGFKLSGGSIRNALLAAAFFAAAEGSSIAMRHLIHGVRRELQKAGKAIGELDSATLEPLVPANEEVLLGYG